MGISVGLAFPYLALQWLWLSSTILSALLIFNILAADVKSWTRQLITTNLSSLALTCLILFGAVPGATLVAASFVIHDRSLFFGLALAALAPSAFVVPIFVKKNGGNSALALLAVMVTTALAPLVTVPLLFCFGFDQNFFAATPLILTLVPLTVIPLVIGLLISWFTPTWRERIAPTSPTISSVLLGLLMFLLVGSAFNKAPVRIWTQSDFWWVVAFMIWLDFGIYAILAYFVNSTVATLVSARNFAIPASLAMFFLPTAALPSAVGLAVHALFFQWLMVKSASQEA